MFFDRLKASFLTSQNRLQKRFKSMFTFKSMYRCALRTYDAFNRTSHIIFEWLSIIAIHNRNLIKADPLSRSQICLHTHQRLTFSWSNISYTIIYINAISCGYNRCYITDYWIDFHLFYYREVSLLSWLFSFCWLAWSWRCSRLGKWLPYQRAKVWLPIFKRIQLHLKMFFFIRMKNSRPLDCKYASGPADAENSQLHWSD